MPRPTWISKHTHSKWLTWIRGSSVLHARCRLRQQRPKRMVGMRESRQATNAA